MPIHIATRGKRDIVTFLSDVTVDFVSLVDHGANWSPFALIKHDARGEVFMPGQVIQAIVMPVEMDVDRLRRLYGDEWFTMVRTDKRHHSSTRVRYTQRNESDFEEYERNAAFVLRDIADTGGHFVVGTLRAEKRTEPALMLPWAGISTSNSAEPLTRSSNHTGGNNRMTADEIRELVRVSLADAEAGIRKDIETRLEEMETRLDAIEGDGASADASADETTSGAATKTQQLQSALGDVMKELETLGSRISNLAEKQESLEHATVGRPSSSEDAVPGERTTRVSPFRGMFAGG